MDSSHHTHSNWLGFSLSNNTTHHHSDSSNLCLFEAFNHTPAGTSAAEDINGATDLSIFTGGPKLEDFLGGCRGSTTAPQSQPQPPQPSQSPLNHHFATHNTTLPQAEIYDSELKTIAAGFLRGFSNEQTDAAKKQPAVLVNSVDSAAKKTVDTFGQRTSIYRGVTRHRWTGRYEAHLWDNSCRREGQSRKGRQVYLGGYDKEEKAARAYDLAALKYWGPTTTTNFPISDYEKELEEMKHMTRQEFVASLRRKSSGFSRGASIYRGVTRHHQHGRWQARIGRVAGNKDLYLGTFSTQEEAAEAYDIAAIKFRGLNAVTNFDMSRYDVKSIMSSNLPIGGISGKSKNCSDSTSDSASGGGRLDESDPSSASSLSFASQPPASTLSFAIPIKQDSSDCWSLMGYPNLPLNNGTKGSYPGSAMFQSANPGSSAYQNMQSYNMDFSAHNPVSQNGNAGIFNSVFVQQQSGSSSTSTITATTNTTTTTSGSTIPFASPIGLSGSTSSNSHDGSGSGGYGSWISPSIYSIQAAKENLSVFQTPIFGME